MAKLKKNGTNICYKIDTKVYKALQNYCQKVGQTKTMAIERAIQQMIELYEETGELYTPRKSEENRTE